MRKIGFIINIHAKKARKNPALIQKLIESFPDQQSIWTPRTLQELFAVTKKILDDRYEVIFLSGGDGTFRATVESFVNHQSTQPLPYFVLLQGGTGGLYSKHYYGVQNPLVHLQTTLKKLESAVTLQGTALNILNVNGKYGFIFAVGGLSNLLAYYMSHAERSIALANWLIFRLILSFIFRTPFYRKISPQFTVQLQKDAGPLETIEVTTRYELFKPANDAGDVYVRITSSINNFSQPMWAIGRENKFGRVSFISVPLSDNQRQSLEKEYQKSLKK